MKVKIERRFYVCPDEWNEETRTTRIGRGVKKWQ